MLNLILLRTIVLCVFLGLGDAKKGVVRPSAAASASSQSAASANNGVGGGTENGKTYSDCYWVIQAWPKLGLSISADPAVDTSCCKIDEVTCIGKKVTEINFKKSKSKSKSSSNAYCYSLMNEKLNLI